MLSNTLLELGLTQKEIKVYLALLPLGSAPASVLGYRTEMPRSSARYTCQQLVKKGFISQIQKGNTFIYVPEDPEKLTYQLEQEKRQIKEKEEKMNRVVGELQSMINPDVVLPKVKFYEGLDKVLRSYWEFLDNLPEGSTIYNYVSPVPDTKLNHKLRSAIRKFIKLRKDKKLKCKTLCTYGEDAIRLKMTDKSFDRETRITAVSQRTPFICEILLCEHFILDASFADNAVFSTLSSNKDLASMRMAIFETAWAQAEKETEILLKEKESKTWMDRYRGVEEY